MRPDPKNSKNTVKPSELFTLFGSGRVKASRKHFDEIDPRRNKFIAMDFN